MEFPKKVEGTYIYRVIKKRYINEYGKTVLTKLEDGYYMYINGQIGSIMRNVTDAIAYIDDKPEGFQQYFLKVLYRNWGGIYTSEKSIEAERMFSEWKRTQELDKELTNFKDKWLKESIMTDIEFKCIGYITTRFEETVRSSTFVNEALKEVYVNDKYNIYVIKYINSNPTGNKLDYIPEPYVKVMEHSDISRLLSLPKNEPKFITFKFQGQRYYI